MVVVITGLMVGKAIVSLTVFCVKQAIKKDAANERAVRRETQKRNYAEIERLRQGHQEQCKKATEPLYVEIERVRQEHQKLHEEHQKLHKEHQKLYEEHQKLHEEHQKLHEEHEKAHGAIDYLHFYLFVVVAIEIITVILMLCIQALY